VTPPASRPATRPNVLVLLADDLGWNGVGFHNPKSPTPNLNRLAQEGLELRRFYSYPVCSPARAALLTGLMPRRLGLVDVIGPRQAGLPKGGLTLPGVFRSAGYQTSLVGKWHLGRENPPTQIGFDHFYGFLGPQVDYFTHADQRGDTDWQRDGKTVAEEGYSTYLLADEAVRQMRARDPARPFFMEVAFNAPHVPLAAPVDLVAKHKAGGGVYAAVIEAMDVGIGRVLAAVDDLGLRDDTIVVFYSDNGAARRESDNAPLAFGKGTVYEGGIRTPCVVRWPGRVPAGAASDQPVCGQDWLPTLAAAAGVPVPADAKLDGTDQWPAVRTGRRFDREPLVIAAYDIALIDGDWKLIEWADGAYSLLNLRTDVSETTDEYLRQPDVAGRMTAEMAEVKKGLPDAPPRRAAGGGQRGRPAGAGR
jgi:arylsulfatase A-like enzyme